MPTAWGSFIKRKNTKHSAASLLPPPPQSSSVLLPSHPSLEGGLDGLRQVLVMKYGNLVKAWQLGIDVEGRGWVDLTDFTAACHNLGFQRGIRKVFRQLDRSGEGEVTLKDLDPESANVYELFKSCLVETYGSLLQAFRRLESKQRTNIVNEGRVSDLMDSEGERKRGHLAALPRPSTASTCRLPTSVLSRPATTTKPSPSTVSGLSRPATASRLPLEASDQPCGLTQGKGKGKATATKPRPATATHESFRKSASASDLTRARPSTASHGVKSVHPSTSHSSLQHGLLDLDDFKQLCEDVKFGGDAEQLFSWLDADKAGAISIEEIDPRVALTLFRELDLMEAGIISNVTDPNRTSQRASDVCTPTIALLKYNFARIERRKQLEEQARLARENGLDGLKRLLTRKYGTLVNAWKSSLDRNSVGRVSYFDFCRSCREVGFAPQGNGVRKLWTEMDGAERGFVSLYDIDDNVAKLIQELAACVTEAWGSAQAAWEGTFSPHGKPKIALAEFAPACKRIGYKGDAAALMKALDCSRSGYLSFQDFSFVEAWFVRAGNAQIAGELRQDSKYVDSTYTDQIFGRTMTSSAILRHRLGQEQREQIERDSTDWTLADFRKDLDYRFGNYARAWRKGLDPDVHGRITYNEFFKACRRIGVSGSVKKVWQELDETSKGTITIHELDRRTGEILQEFDSTVMRDFNSWAEVWNLVFDPAGVGSINESTFCDALEDFGFDDMEIQEKLFRYLDLDRTRHLTLDSLRWISEVASKSLKSVDEGELWENKKSRLPFSSEVAPTKGSRKREDVIKEKIPIGKSHTGRTKTEIRGLEYNVVKRLAVGKNVPCVPLAWGDGWDPECFPKKFPS